MRISDWSSDVCSSDLRIKGVFFDAQIALGHIAVIGEALVQRLRLADVNSLRRRQGIVGRRHHALATADLLIQMHQVGLLRVDGIERSEEHTSELQSLMRISYAVFCLKKKKKYKYNINNK